MTPSVPGAASPVAIVLAAGASRRMGTAKALLPWRGVPLVAHLCQTFHTAGVPRVLVVIAPGAVGDTIQEVLPAVGAHTLLNPAPERGMLSSMQAALHLLTQEDAPCPDFLVCPVDLPLLEARHIMPLTAPLAPPFQIAAPIWNGKRGHPTRFSGELAREILSLDPVAAGLNHLVRRYDLVGQVCELAAVDAAILRDTDTPEEWAALAGAVIFTGEQGQ